MKPKRLLALLLALVLAFGLAMPAIAQESLTEHSSANADTTEGSATKNPAMPVITVQPQVLMYNDTSFEIRFEAHIPNGDPMGIRWYDAGTGWLVASDPAAFWIGVSVDFLGLGGGTTQFRYYVEAYNRTTRRCMRAATRQRPR